VPELNRRVSQAIVGRIAAVRDAARKGAEVRTSCLLLLGPAGAGKTHLFVRLRRTLGPRAAFVHLRPLVGTEMTPRYVLGQIVQQLAYEATTPSGRGYKQLDALVGSSLAVLEGEPPDYPRAFLDELHGLREDRRRERLERAVEAILARHQEADETYLARLLEAPFMQPADQRAALAWLAGRELEESQGRRLGVTFGLPEERILQCLQTLGLFAAPGAPIVLVFDQLENLVDGDATPGRVRSYGNLVSELTDTTRGYVVVQMALDSEWERAIFPELSLAQRTRVGGHVEVIDLPSPAQRRDLVRRWVDELPDRAQAFPWPFGERSVARWCNAPGMTPRMLMIACREALAVPNDGRSGGDDPKEPKRRREAVAERIASRPTDENNERTSDDRTRGGPAHHGDTSNGDTSNGDTSNGDARNDDSLAASWDNHLMLARRALDEAGVDRRGAEAGRLVGGMASAMRLAPGTSVARLDARQAVQMVVRAGTESHAVVLVHQTHPRSVAMALERAAESLAGGGVLVVRERALDFPPTWKRALALQSDLLRRGGRWLTLDRDETARLLALESFLAAARSRDVEDRSGRALEEREVCAWVVRALGLSSWPLVEALVARPKSVATESGPRASMPPSERGATQDASSPRADTEATTFACLAQLRIASVDRLVREVARVSPGATRADVMNALRAMGDRVRWFGRSIVAVQGPS
jgi:hypothetical protein